MPAAFRFFLCQLAWYVFHSPREVSLIVNREWQRSAPLLHKFTYFIPGVLA